MKPKHDLERRLEAFQRLFDGRWGSDKLWIWGVGVFCVMPVLGYVLSYPIRFIVLGCFKVLGLATDSNAIYMAVIIMIASLFLAFIAYLYLWRMYDGKTDN